MSAQTRYSAYTRDQEEILAPAFETALADSGSSFMDKVAQLLETQEKEALAMARQPLGSLFDHYLESPALNRPEKDLEKDMGFKENDVYSMLEQAGKTIDQMINNMVKGLFENTLSQVA
ncbi:MAG: hypothetical protein HUK40_09395 [Desulfobacter sp.]|nr:hypothetical protein [Desulfobacter sp.]